MTKHAQMPVHKCLWRDFIRSDAQQEERRKIWSFAENHYASKEIVELILLYMAHSTRNDEGSCLYGCTEKQSTTTAKVMCRIISVFCSWWQNISFRFIWKQIISNKHISLWHHTNWTQFIFGRINLNLCTFNLRNRRIFAACICLSDPYINSVEKTKKNSLRTKRTNSLCIISCFTFHIELVEGWKFVCKKSIIACANAFVSE